MSDRIPFRVHPMLATLVSTPFNRPGWVYEEKYDGYRILAYKERDRVTLMSRNDKDRTGVFKPVADAVAALAPPTLLLDGEVVAFDSKHVSRFQLLQERPAKVEYAVFDCLYKDGQDLRKLPLHQRQKVLEAVVPRAGAIFLTRRLARTGSLPTNSQKEKVSKESSRRISLPLILKGDPRSGSESRCTRKKNS